jgi:hypothetical protein
VREMRRINTIREEFANRGPDLQEDQVGQLPKKRHVPRANAATPGPVDRRQSGTCSITLARPPCFNTSP